MKAWMFLLGFCWGVLCTFAWAAYALWLAWSLEDRGPALWAFAVLMTVFLSTVVMCCVLAHQEEQRKKGGEKPANPPTSAPDVHGGG
jgi:drug/metabolite transporter (DMT)-like permease